MKIKMDLTALEEATHIDYEAEDQLAELKRRYEVAILELTKLAIPTTRTDYTTKELDDVVCRLAAGALREMGEDAEARIHEYLEDT